MNEENCIKAGEKAPDFTLKDQDSKDIRLAGYKGKKILLSFHPLAWTPVCAKQMKSLEDHKEEFDALNTVALGISVDTVPSKKAWTKELNIKNTRLLSDFWQHGHVASLYGIFRKDDGISERANIIIDENQIVTYVQLYELSQLPEIREIINVLKTLSDQ